MTYEEEPSIFSETDITPQEYAKNAVKDAELAFAEWLEKWANKEFDIKKTEIEIEEWQKKINYEYKRMPKRFSSDQDTILKIFYELWDLKGQREVYLFVHQEIEAKIKELRSEGK